MTNADMPAMPVVLPDGSVADGSGLTKREYFAAMAMQGILSNDEAVSGLSAASGANNIGLETLMAASAVMLADALLAELDKEAT